MQWITSRWWAYSDQFHLMVGIPTARWGWRFSEKHIHNYKTVCFEAILLSTSADNLPLGLERCKQLCTIGERMEAMWGTALGNTEAQKAENEVKEYCKDEEKKICQIGSLFLGWYTSSELEKSEICNFFCCISLFWLRISQRVGYTWISLS